LLALLHTNEVVVEEVNIETCLEHTGKDLCPAIEIVEVISVDPIEYVEEPV